LDIYSPIFNRASTRKYDGTPLSAEMLEQIESFIASVKPLLPDVKLSHQVVGFDAVKGLAIPKAPHFLLISGKEQPLRNTCAGFLYQHVVLYLCSMGLAARWISGVKHKESNPDHIIGIAFGKPIEPAVRKQSEFKRKSLDKIAEGKDSRLEAVRLAPSGMNGQPWYFIVDGHVIHAYYKPSLGWLLGKLYHMTDIDVGIALCHLAVASEHEGKPFHFMVKENGVPIPPQGFVYVGTVE